MNPWDLARSVGTTIFEGINQLSGRTKDERTLAADILENDSEYLIIFDAPGANQSDIQVRYVDGDVLVRIDRFREFHEGFEMQSPGRVLSLDGSVSLPADALIDPDSATATLSSLGTLKIHIPKGSKKVTAKTSTAEEHSPLHTSDETR